MSVNVHHGDSREVLKGFPDNHFDAVCTDPPYALVSIGKRFGKEGSAPAKGDVYRRASAGFMNAKWDVGDVAFSPDFWREVMRVLKPGGHVVAFGGTRSYHRLACAVEDAGFEVRDCVFWCYASGFPKNHDASKAIDKHLGAGRSRKPVEHRANPSSSIHASGFGAPDWAPQVDEAATPEAATPEAATPEAATWSGWGTALKPAVEPAVVARKPLSEKNIAANVLAHGTGVINIDGCRIGLVGGTPKPPSDNKSSTDSIGGYLNAQSGKLNGKGRWPANLTHDGSDEVLDAFPDAPGQQRAVTSDERAHRTANVYGDFGRSDGGFEPRGDDGSAARFFFTAKADAVDRLASTHPTVKPVNLMRWLCRLVTPPGGRVLDPFAGSGSTGVACLAEGFDCDLIEREADYVADIHRRIKWAQGEGELTRQAKQRKGSWSPPSGDGHDLFALAGIDDAPKAEGGGSTAATRASSTSAPPNDRTNRPETVNE